MIKILIIGLMLIFVGCGEKSQEQINNEIIEQAKEQRIEKENQLNLEQQEIYNKWFEEQKLIYNNIMSKCLSSEDFRNSLLREDGDEILEVKGYAYWKNADIPYTKIETSKDAPDVYEADDKERIISLTHPSVELCELIKYPGEDDNNEMITLIVFLVTIILLFFGILTRLGI
jgi:hypothetical protein